MGVEYSTNSAWGLEISESALEVHIPGYEDDPYSSVHSYFEENFNGLEIIDTGSMWTGKNLGKVMIISATLTDLEDLDTVVRPKTPLETDMLHFRAVYGILTGEPKDAESIIIGHIY